jgi:hypothetical protein
LIYENIALYYRRMVAQSKLPVMMHEEDVIDPRYVNGKIYLVKCKYDNDLVYVGSTIRDINIRFREHTYEYSNGSKNTTLHNVVCGDWDNWYIELYENYPCNNKYILEKREGEVIRNVATINRCITGRTKKEYKKDNQEQIKKKTREYLKKNKERTSKKHKDYLEKNKEYFKEKRAEKIVCGICGFEGLKMHLKRHQRGLNCKSVQS